MPRFQDIPEYTRHAGYMVNVPLDHLARQYIHYVVDYGLDVCPDFQRGYVWSMSQKERFIEHFLRGGMTGMDVYLNCPNWNELNRTVNTVLVDGKQRLDAAFGFLNNEVKAFGHYYREYTDSPRFTRCTFRWHVNDLRTRREVLQWYLDLNSGGIVHPTEELDRVRILRDETAAYPVTQDEDRIRDAGLLSNAYLIQQREKMDVEEEESQARAKARAAIETKPKTKAKKKK